MTFRTRHAAPLPTRLHRTEHPAVAGRFAGLLEERTAAGISPAAGTALRTRLKMTGQLHSDVHPVVLASRM